MPFVAAPAPFVLIVVAHWLIVSLSITGYVEVMRAIYPDALRGRAMAYVRVGFTACATVMTPLFGQLLDAWSYQMLFPFAALFGVLSGVTFGQVTYEEEVAATRHDWLKPWRIFLQDARYRDVQHRVYDLRYRHSADRAAHSALARRRTASEL